MRGVRSHDLEVGKIKLKAEETLSPEMLPNLLDTLLPRPLLGVDG